MSNFDPSKISGLIVWSKPDEGQVADKSDRLIAWQNVANQNWWARGWRRIQRWRLRRSGGQVGTRFGDLIQVDPAKRPKLVDGLARIKGEHELWCDFPPIHTGPCRGCLD